MLEIIVERKSAVRQAQHAIVVRRVTGKQGGPARRTSRRGVEGMPEQNAIASELLQIWRRDLDAIGLDVSARVVRMQIDDVGTHTRRVLRLRTGSGGCRYKSLDPIAS